MSVIDTHVLRFPTGLPVGWVKVPCAGPDPHGNWDDVGVAVGDVAITGNKPVRLVVEPAAARDLSWLGALLPTDLAELYLQQSEVTDKGLKHVSRLTGLRTLSLSHNYANVTDAGLAHVRSLTQLRRLCLNATDVSDVGLSYLRDCARLEGLTLGATRVTDNGLLHLHALRSLRTLSFDGSYAGRRRTLVTDAGISAFRTAMPNCVVVAIDAIDR